MNILRRRIDPKTFVITLQQIAKYLNINPKRILNWQKWPHVLWVHIQGRGGYFVSYRQLEQWIAACGVVMRGCRQIEALATVWNAICKEAERYTNEGLARLQQTYRQRQAQLYRDSAGREDAIA